MPSVIPLHLRLAGFLSYRDPAELDFTQFDLACISGANGAGKSTLLDAMTWALFGQARRRDESLINLQSEAAEVAFTFRYEGADYRVLRSLRRGKPAVLELQIRPLQAEVAEGTPGEGGGWKPLTERTQKETQARIEQILRLDYETFVNASFFLQGKADTFAQQTPARRKEVLGNILGMEIWEEYKARTAELRRQHEGELAAVEARVNELEGELAEELQRRERLEELERELGRLATARKAQAAALESARSVHAVLERQRLLLAEQTASLERARGDLKALRERLADRQQARTESDGLVQHADEIESAYRAWKVTVKELERWDGIARDFRDHETKRAPLLQAIAAEQARLEQEHSHLRAIEEQLNGKSEVAGALDKELRQAQAEYAEIEERLKERDALQARAGAMREAIAEKTAENRALKEKMDELKGRIDLLEATASAECPLCGQALTSEHRVSTIKRLRADGTSMGDQYRSNNAAIQQIKISAAELEAQLETLRGIDDLRVEHSRSVSKLTERLGSVKSEMDAWEKEGRLRLVQVGDTLQSGGFATEARARLSIVDQELAALGYAAAAHDGIRAREAQQRASDEQHTRLQAAEAALKPLNSEIQNLETQIAKRASGLKQQEEEVQRAQQEIQAAGAGLPDLVQAESDLFALQEQENTLNQDVGAARQKVAILGSLRQRRTELEGARQSLAVSIGRHKMLESAFGKDGVPALLIEQALPEVESRANELLDRLSDGRMSVHFETQTAYRDRKREDLRETLEIKISDGAGKRDYEMYSGGEAFRANFAIRLALSEVLAGRKGARLQTLVVDEGFGSQDDQGIQRLIETINLIRPDFAKILIISHLDELKDAFPTRIEVEKTERGSVLRVN